MPLPCEGSFVKTDGRWVVLDVDGADVRLRSRRIGLISVDVRAPVSAGQLKTGSVLTEGAARSLLRRNDARVLNYSGQGATGSSPWQVSGHAVAADVDIGLTLTITAAGPPDDPMAQIELAGAANLGTVNVPLPGLGRVDDFSFQVDARLVLSRMSD